MTDKKRIYVAAPWASALTARAVMQTFRDKGHAITCDWTDAFVAQNGQSAGQSAGGSEPEVTTEARVAAAIADFEGVRTADVVVVLSVADKTQGCGMWLESGGALLRGIPTVMVGPQNNRSVFHELAVKRFKTVDEAVAYVNETPFHVLLAARQYVPPPFDWISTRGETMKLAVSSLYGRVGLSAQLDLGSREARAELPTLPEAAPFPVCDHGVTFDEEAAKDLDSDEVRKRWPRGWGPCPKGCGFSGIAYASAKHYTMGDW